MEGYVYKVYDLNQNFLGWMSFDPTNITSSNRLNFAYTLLTTKITPNQEVASTNNAITIFPNPSTHQQTIKINTEKTEDLSIQLMDIQGRLIKQVFIGKSDEGSTLIQTDVEDLASAMYVYEVKLGSKLSYVRFFKQ